MQHIIDKIHKLIALSKSQNENEARNAFAAAQRLADNHKLDLLNLGKASGQAAVFDVYQIDTGKRVWKQYLLNAIAQMNRVRVIRFTGTSICKLYGEENDIIFVSHFFLWIVDQCYKFAARAPSQEKTYLSSFRQGFVERVVYRLREERAHLEPNAIALLVDLTKVNEFVESTGVKIKRSKKPKALSVRLYSERGYRDGHTAGTFANLSNSSKLEE